MRLAIVLIACVRCCEAQVPRSATVGSIIPGSLSNISYLAASGKRPVTVGDAIAMTRLADPDYFIGASSTGHVAHFCPDGSKFVVVLRKGNIRKNTNDFSLLLFKTKDVLRSPAADLLLTMSSSSNRDAIGSVKWLSNDLIAFLGEKPHETPQIYTVNVRTRRIERLTSHPTPIIAYDMSQDGGELAFVAEPPDKNNSERDPTCQRVVVIDKQSLPDLLTNKCVQPPWDSKELYLKSLNRKPVVVALSARDAITERSPISLAPDGSYALIGTFMRDMPLNWRDYKDERLHELVTEESRSGTSPFVTRYVLVNTKKIQPEPLLNVPMLGGFSAAKWAADSRSVFVKGTYLPTRTALPLENAERESAVFNVEIKLPSKNYAKIRPEAWPAEESVTPDLDVTLEEDLNGRPIIYAARRGAATKLQLLDLNPQLFSLEFGSVQRMTWRTSDGAVVQGGLYLPPDFRPNLRYPLVIQMHGFDPNRFSMDGRADWGCGYAARPLAAKGFVVLQVAGGGFIDSPQEGPFQMDKIERAIDYLTEKGLVASDFVGVIGFSRGAYDVAYTLTHSRYRFKAAILVDGFDGGYFQYLVGRGSKTDYAHVNGGSPYGDGLKSWIQNSPSFNVDKVQAAVRLVALSDGPLALWEWFALSIQMRKPVDFIWLPIAPHMIVKPSEWMVSTEGSVDWFCFWLKGEEDPVAEKRAQYVRWRKLQRE